MAATAGLAVFLAFLTVAVQVTVNLHSASLVTTAAFEAAGMVASSGQAPLDRRGIDAAEAHARSLLGPLGDDVRFSWGADAEVIELRVVVRTPRVLLPVVDGALGLDVIDRTVTVRREEVQG